LIYYFSDFVLDTSRREMRRGEDHTPLEPQVFGLLEFLVRARDRVVSRDELHGQIDAAPLLAEATRRRLFDRAVSDKALVYRQLLPVSCRWYDRARRRRLYLRACYIARRKRPKSNETKVKSTRLIDLLPLITVWLQVRVLPGPPAFAREVSEGRQAAAHRAQAGRACELRLGKPKDSLCAKKRS
jgi:hypothetical protein